MRRFFWRFLRWSRVLKFCRENLLLSLTIMSVIVGLSLGFILRQTELSAQTVQLINFPGEIFLQVLKLMILPLIFSSLISALAQLDAKAAGQMGLITVSYYALTTVLSIATGIALVLFIHPGNPNIKTDGDSDVTEHTAVSALDTFLDVVRNMFPENVIQATFQRVQTNYYTQKPKTRFNASSKNQAIVKKRIDYVEGMNILGVIVFCTGFGIVVSQFGERTKIIVDFFIILEAVIMKLIETFMWLAPLGIVCLIAGNILELDDLSGAISVLAMYVLTIMCGLAFHTIFTMPLLCFFLTRKNPLIIAKGMTQALVTSFGTASGGAALPVSMQCMEDNLKVDRRITRFVLPLGSTINLDGNALYEAIAVIFIAQLNNVEMPFSEVITVSMIATIASLGLNSVPAGLVSILLILNTVGLPTRDVSLLITVDWLIDRVRTAVNVLGDAYAANVVAYCLQEQLIKNDQDEYHNEIKEEIVLLKSAAASRKASFANVFDIRSAPYPFGFPMLLPHSRSQSFTTDVVSWRALLERMRNNFALSSVKNV